MRTESRPQAICVENLVKFGRVVAEMRADRQADGHAYRNVLRSPIGG